MKKITVICCILLGLTSCGFHLRGTTPGHVINYPISVNRNHIGQSFFRAVKIALRDSQPQIPDNHRHQIYHLDLLDEQITKNLATTGTNTLTKTYILTYNITYQLFDPKGNPLSLPEHVEIHRPYNENINTMLASQHEENTYLAEMRREAAIRTLNQISIQMRHYENQKPRSRQKSST